MCLGHPKRPRSLPDSTLDPGHASHKPVQKVRTPHPRWHNVTRDLMHACKLSSMCRAAAQSTRTPGTEPARLGPTACTFAILMALPTASTAHWTESVHMTAQNAAQCYNCCPMRDVRSKRTTPAHSCHPGRLTRRSSTQLPPVPTQPLERPLTVPGGSRPQVDRFESISNVVRGATR